MPKGITSLEGYIRKLAKIHATNSGIQLLFRGHSKKSYINSPSVFRTNNHEKSEHLMIRQLISQHPKEFYEDKWIFDQLVRAQHYGLPTRLLDVSLNPLVALYFAVCSNPSHRASIVLYKPNLGRQKYFDSDAVSCLSALSLLTQGEKDAITAAMRLAYKSTSAQVNFDDLDTFLLNGEELESFNRVPEIGKLLQLVCQEKPNFRPILQPIDLIRPVAVVPKKIHARILAQNGAFILFGLAHQANHVNMKHIEVEEIDIEKSAKPRILRELSTVGITESSMFPEIERSAIAIKNRYS